MRKDNGPVVNRLVSAEKPPRCDSCDLVKSRISVADVAPARTITLLPLLRHVP